MSMKDQLKKRMAESNKRASAFGEGGGSLRGTDETKFWNPEIGQDHVIDIVPYIAGPGSPLDPESNWAESKNPEGEWAYVLEFWEHRNLGSDGSGKILCLSKNWNKPCPVCEHRRRLMEDGADEKTIKALKPSLRCAYNVIVYDGGKWEKVSPVIWVVSHYYSEEAFQALAKKRRRGDTSSDPYIYFMDAKEGKSISFEQLGKKDMMKMSGIKFEDRDYDIDKDALDDAIQLESLLRIPEYKDVFQFYWGEPFDEDDPKKPIEQSSGRSSGSNEDEPSSRRGRRRSGSDEEKATEEEKGKDEGDEPSRRRRRRSSSDEEKGKDEGDEGESSGRRGRRRSSSDEEKGKDEGDEPSRRRRRRSSSDEEKEKGGKDPAELVNVDFEPMKKGEIIAKLKEYDVEFTGKLDGLEDMEEDDVFFAVEDWLDENYRK